MRNQVLLQAISLLLASIVLLAYNDDPPNGRTGAPFNGHCRDCHSSGNPGGFNGLAEIVGLPDTIQPNTTYSLQMKVTRTAGNPLKAGFQLVIVDKNNDNAGNLTANNNESDTAFLLGREYLDHRGGKLFNGAPISWSFHWTSPAQAACNTLKFFYIVNFANGDGSDFADFPIAFADSVYFAGGPPLAATVATLQNNICVADTNGIVQAQANGGLSPYSYQWSNGAVGPVISALASGSYAVTIQDDDACTVTRTTTVNAVDSVSPQIICPLSFSVCAGDTIDYQAPMVLDNCDLDEEQPELVSGLPSGSVFPVGSTIQMFQVTDEMGHTATCSFNVQVDSPPTAQVDTIIHDVGNAGVGSIAIITGGGSGTLFTYRWEKDGMLFSDSTEDISGLYAGIYSLEVTDSPGCSVRLAALVVKNTVGLTNMGQLVKQPVMLPNPVKDYFRIAGWEFPPNSMELINLQAQVIRIFSVTDWPSPFYIGDFPDGLYLLKITAANGPSLFLKLAKK